MSEMERPALAELDLEALPLDVFELVDIGLEVESLTAGHGQLENGASGGRPSYCVCCSCSGNEHM